MVTSPASRRQTSRPRRTASVAARTTLPREATRLADSSRWMSVRPSTVTISAGLATKNVVRVRTPCAVSSRTFRCARRKPSAMTRAMLAKPARTPCTAPLPLLAPPAPGGTLRGRQPGHLEPPSVGRLAYGGAGGRAVHGNDQEGHDENGRDRVRGRLRGPPGGDRVAAGRRAGGGVRRRSRPPGRGGRAARGPGVRGAPSAPRGAPAGRRAHLHPPRPPRPGPPRLPGGRRGGAAGEAGGERAGRGRAARRRRRGASGRQDRRLP